MQRLARIPRSYCFLSPKLRVRCHFLRFGNVSFQCTGVLPVWFFFRKKGTSREDLFEQCHHILNVTEQTADRNSQTSCWRSEPRPLGLPRYTCPSLAVRGAQVRTGSGGTALGRCAPLTAPVWAPRVTCPGRGGSLAAAPYEYLLAAAVASLQSRSSPLRHASLAAGMAEPLGDELSSAAARGDLQRVRGLLQDGASADARNRFNRTALQVMKLGVPEIAEILLHSGADPNLMDPTGFVVLHDAAREGFADTVRTLLLFGADAKARDREGNLPLHLAAMEGHLEVVACLLEHTDSTLTQNGQGHTAYDLARAHKREGVVKWMEENPRA
ncbi:cyclin-dependent kinase 4 inhibitor C [Lissotriton helveticus]